MARSGAALMRAYQGQLPDSALRGLVDALQDDGLCILPAEAHYLMVCSLAQPKAVERLLGLHGLRDAVRRPRYGADADPQAPPLTLFCHSLQQAAAFVRVGDEAFAFIREASPGPCAFLLPVKNSFPNSIGRIKAISLRIPRHTVPRHVAQALDAPLLAVAVPHDDSEPEYALDATLIHERWAHQVDTIVDDGVLSAEPIDWYDCTGSQPIQL